MASRGTVGSPLKKANGTDHGVVRAFGEKSLGLGGGLDHETVTHSLPAAVAPTLLVKKGEMINSRILAHLHKRA